MRNGASIGFESSRDTKEIGPGRMPRFPNKPDQGSIRASLMPYNIKYEHIYIFHYKYHMNNIDISLRRRRSTSASEDQQHKLHDFELARLVVRLNTEFFHHVADPDRGCLIGARMEIPVGVSLGRGEIGLAVAF